MNQKKLDILPPFVRPLGSSEYVLVQGQFVAMLQPHGLDRAATDAAWKSTS